jgi:hypothetical protein
MTLSPLGETKGRNSLKGPGISLSRLKRSEIKEWSPELAVLTQPCWYQTVGLVHDPEGERMFLGLL